MLPHLKESHCEQVCQALPAGNSGAVAELGQMGEECLATVPFPYTGWAEALLLMALTEPNLNLLNKCPGFNQLFPPSSRDYPRVLVA